jgi:hypothetical protein
MRPSNLGGGGKAECVTIGKDNIYAGVSGVEIRAEGFDLGDGIMLSRTYAHLFAPYMMAFAKPVAGGFHPPPWRAARGGFGVDVTVEIRVPVQAGASGATEAREDVWLIAALLRLAHYPYLTVPVLSDMPFASAATTQHEPHLEPFETEQRMFGAPAEQDGSLDEATLTWLRDKRVPTKRMMSRDRRFETTLKAFDLATVRGRSATSLLTLWGGIEQLFAPSAGELRFRVASFLASYLEPPGDRRYQCFKQLMKLYNLRSLAAHTAQEVEPAPVVETFVLMRNALVRMVDESRIPSQADLEALLFGREEA